MGDDFTIALPLDQVLDSVVSEDSGPLERTLAGDVATDCVPKGSETPTDTGPAGPLDGDPTTAAEGEASLPRARRGDDRADRSDDTRREDGTTGEKRLVGAMLTQALEDLKLGGTAREDAFGWIFQPRERQPWSFNWCCEILGLSPEAVRRQVGGLRPSGSPFADSAAGPRRRTAVGKPRLRDNGREQRAATSSAAG